MIDDIITNDVPPIVAPKGSPPMYAFCKEPYPLLVGPFATTNEAEAFIEEVADMAGMEGEDEVLTRDDPAAVGIDVVTPIEFWTVVMNPRA